MRSRRREWSRARRAGVTAMARKKLSHTVRAAYSSSARAIVEGRWAMASLAQLERRPPTPNSNWERTGKR